jgi:hypothetical protein
MTVEYMKAGERIVEAMNILRAEIGRTPLRFSFESKFNYLEVELPLLLNDAFLLTSVPSRKKIVVGIVSLLLVWETDLISFFKVLEDSIILTLEHLDNRAKNHKEDLEDKHSSSQAATKLQAENTFLQSQLDVQATHVESLSKDNREFEAALAEKRAVIEDMLAEFAEKNTALEQEIASLKQQ